MSLQDVMNTSFVDNSTVVFPTTSHILLDDGSFKPPSPVAGKSGLTTSKNVYTDWTVVSWKLNILHFDIYNHKKLDIFTFDSLNINIPILFL